MKEVKTIETTLQPYVEKLLQGLEKGVDLAAEHIPDVIMQYVIFEAIIAWLTIIFLGIILPVIIFKLSHKLVKRDQDDLPYIVNLFSIIGIIPATLSISTAIKATFFPKLFLISEFIKIF